MGELRDVVERLVRARFEFVLVGAYAATVHGASVVTRDVDACAPFTKENLLKLRDALVHRMTPQRLPLELTEENILTLRNLFLATDLGPLDCLSEVIAVGDYTAVRERSVVIQFSFGPVRVLDLDALIATKSHLNRLQDKLAIPQLLAIKERQNANRH